MIQSKTVDITPMKITLPVIEMSQYDLGREIIIHMKDGSDWFDLTGYTAKLQGTKPSGFGYTVDGVVDGHDITFASNYDMTSEAGFIPSEVRLTKDGVSLGSLNVILHVEKTPHDVTVTDGSPETIIPEMTELVERAEAAAEVLLDCSAIATTLPAGSSATASYDVDDGVFHFGIPRGNKGETGDTGETGNGIASITKTGTSGLVDTYTITYTDGTTTTFTVTNGRNGTGSVADVWQNGVSVLDGSTAKVTVPTKTSDITNDSGYITSSALPTKVSDLTNDAGYITGYTETDPVFSASAASDITSADITKLNGFNVATPKADADQYATFAELPLKAGTYVVLHANGTTADSDSPMPSYTGECWWNVVNVGTHPLTGGTSPEQHEPEWYQRILQIASVPYRGVATSDIFYRVRHDDTWSEWHGLSALYQEPFGPVSGNYTSFASMQSAIDDFTNGNNHLRRQKTFIWCIVNYSGSDVDAPVTTSATYWWNVLTIGSHANNDKRQTQIAFSCFNNRQHIYLRQWHDTTSYGWYDISPTGTPTTYNWTGYTLGDTSTSTSTGTYTYDDKLMELSLSSLRTGAQLSIGTTGYDVGTISPAPKGKVTCLAHRHDSGTQMGTIEINTSGTIKIYPLNTIPSGVEISAHVMYFHQ